MTPAKPSVRLLLVDQSPAARQKIRSLFEPRTGIQVVGEAGTAQKALKLLAETSPTAVLMDCDLPKPGSFALVTEMMTVHRVPIVMLTKQSRIVPNALEEKALQSGAVAMVALAAEAMGTDRLGQDDLIKTIRTMSEVKVVRRRGTRPSAQEASTRTTDGNDARPKLLSDTGSTDSDEPRSDETIELVAIGASTGGPQVIETILKGLSKRLTVPVVIVQHLSEGFQNNLIQWLSDATGTQIRVAQHGAPLVPGLVYLAPDHQHLEVNRTGHIVLTDDPPENGSRPSVSVLFRSVAKHYGPHAIGILLTGMGRDGAIELRTMRELGATTIAQDEQTSTVHGMPGEAIRLKGARYILPPDRIVSVVERRLPANVVPPPKAAACG